MHKFGARALLSYLPRMWMSPLEFYYDIVTLYSNKQRRNIFCPDVLGDFKFDSSAQLDALFKDIPKSDDFVKTIMNVELKSYLSTILHVSDKLTMAHSLEARVPYLDHRLVEFAFSIPTSFKLYGMNTKYLVREALKKDLPEDIIYRKKSGFGVPLNPWLRTGLYDDIHDIVLSNKARQRGIFRPAVIEKMFKMHRLGIRDFSGKIWSLLNIEIWFRTFIDSQRNANKE